MSTRLALASAFVYTVAVTNQGGRLTYPFITLTWESVVILLGFDAWQ